MWIGPLVEPLPPFLFGNANEGGSVGVEACFIPRARLETLPFERGCARRCRLCFRFPFFSFNARIS